jgi:predicted phosphoribosyltransferase
MGAIASGGACVLNRDVVQALRIPRKILAAVAVRERRELERRERAYRGDRPPIEVRGRTVIVVDDGLATGSTMHAALAALKRLGPARVVVAVPTAASATCEGFRRAVDGLVCKIMPEPFYAVGLSYDDFSQTTDDDVRALVDRARKPTEECNPDPWPVGVASASGAVEPPKRAAARAAGAIADTFPSGI